MSQKRVTHHPLTSLPPNPYNALAWIVGTPKIESNVWIGAFTVIDGSGGLTIGEGVNVSSGAQIITHSSARRTVTERQHPHVDRAPVEIGAHSFIGSNAVILMGSVVGHHSIVAAGAVVTEGSHFPPYSLIVGVPAQRRGDVRWRPSSEATSDEVNSKKAISNKATSKKAISNKATSKKATSD